MSRIYQEGGAEVNKIIPPPLGPTPTVTFCNGTVLSCIVTGREEQVCVCARPVV
ncbi:MAG TPA: hypothetical protein VLZ10_19825 [Thermodesulfobacteriota bacterium]|nr:hypothetical protein [Thermodesulfobacteriota bacterium]